jgi:hypothetical protein
MFRDLLMLFNVDKKKVMHIRLKLLQVNSSVYGNVHDVEHRNLGMKNSNYLGSGMSADVMYAHFPIFSRNPHKRLMKEVQVEGYGATF